MFRCYRSGGDCVVDKVGAAGVASGGGDGVVHIVTHRAHLPLVLKSVLKVVWLLCPHFDALEQL